MIFDWNEDKNQQLLAERGVSFEMAVAKIAQGEIIDVYRHPNPAKYPNQLIFTIELNSYVHCVPFVKQGDTFFSKNDVPKPESDQNPPR